MGTDIHMELERREADELWHRVPHQDLACDAPYCENGLLSQETPNEAMRGTKCWHCGGKGHSIRAFYSDRNYDVFAILADVRNGRGFAGVETGDGFKPISEPRGLPKDLSPEIQVWLDLNDENDEDAEWRAKAEIILGPGWAKKTFDGEESEEKGYWQHPQSFWLGDHSFSWLTVKEILDYDWTQKTRECGEVDPWNFEVWRRTGRPSSWCGGVSGQGIRHITNAEMAKMIDSGDIQWLGPEPDPDMWGSRPYSTRAQREADEVNPKRWTPGNIKEKTLARHYTKVWWGVGYREVAERFLAIVERDVLPLGKSEDLRLVFGFDS